LGGGLLRRHDVGDPLAAHEDLAAVLLAGPKRVSAWSGPAVCWRG
jgi:hypothetical protein